MFSEVFNNTLDTPKLHLRGAQTIKPTDFKTGHSEDRRRDLPIAWAFTFVSFGLSLEVRCFHSIIANKALSW
jgi:hypothetical protein